MKMSGLRFRFKKMLAPIFAPLYRGRGSILMFHRILPDDNLSRVHTKALEVTPERLEEIILFFKQKNYDFIKMEEVRDYLTKKRKNKFVVFTFDDGYIDNYTVAYPIFKKHNIPFTIYITTDMPDEKMVLWHYMLEEMMLKNEKVKLDLGKGSQTFDISNQEKKEKIYNELRRYLIDLHKGERMSKINQWFLEQEGDLLNKVKKLSMTWNQIKKLSNDSLVEIGAHTISHPSLSVLSEDELFQEVSGSKLLLEERIGRKVYHFAYPFGSKNEIQDREVDLLRKSEFKSSVTTREGNVFPAHINYLHALPRIYIGPSTSLKYIQAFTSGRAPFLRDSFNRVITL